MSGASAEIAQPSAVSTPAATMARRSPIIAESRAAAAPERIAPTM
jgi:hypothetical protein